MLANMVGLGAEVPYDFMGPVAPGDTRAPEPNIGTTIANAINAASKAVITGAQTYQAIRHPCTTPLVLNPVTNKCEAPPQGGFIPQQTNYTPWLIGGGAAVIGLGVLAVVMMGGKSRTTTRTVIQRVPARKSAPVRRAPVRKSVRKKKK